MAGVLKCGDITAALLSFSESGSSAFFLAADIFAGRVYAGHRRPAECHREIYSCEGPGAGAERRCVQPGGQRSDESERSALLRLLTHPHSPFSPLFFLGEIPFVCLSRPSSLSSPLPCEILPPFGRALFLSWASVTDGLIIFIPADHWDVCHCWIPPTACGTPFPAEHIPDASPSPGSGSTGQMKSGEIKSSDVRTIKTEARDSKNVGARGSAENRGVGGRRAESTHLSKGA